MNLKCMYYRLKWKLKSLGKEKQRCPRRDEVGSASFMFPGPDHWGIRGKDRCCSYCGSWHPEEFYNFCKQVIASEGQCGTVEIASGKNYKVYVNRPGIHNSDCGAIKFYTPHIPPDKVKEYVDLINNANKLSWDLFKKGLEKYKEGFDKEVSKDGSNKG